MSTQTDPRSLLHVWRRVRGRSPQPPWSPPSRCRTADVNHRALTEWESRTLLCAGVSPQLLLETAAEEGARKPSSSQPPERPPDLVLPRLTGKAATRDAKKRHEFFVALRAAQLQKDAEAAAIADCLRRDALSRAPVSRPVSRTHDEEPVRKPFLVCSTVPPTDESLRPALNPKLTPRQDKSRYVQALADTDTAPSVYARPLLLPSSAVARRRKRRVTSPKHHANPEVTDATLRRAMQRMSKRGIPAAADFTAVSDAIMAVVAATNSASRSRPVAARPLCGDTMTYWDRLNFFGRFAESCNNSEDTMRSAVMRSTHK